jgi:hypothetical protein
MLIKFIHSIWQLPMIWDCVVPLVIIAIWCAVLYWEGVHGHVSRHISRHKGLYR